MAYEPGCDTDIQIPSEVLTETVEDKTLVWWFIIYLLIQLFVEKNAAR